MPQPPSRDDIVREAVALARDVAPDLAAILLTHYPDADTLDALGRVGTDLETSRAVNRAVAAEMLEAGVAVLVQRADKATFRRWMSRRADSMANRLAWTDRERLLRGADALKALGLPPTRAPAPPRFAAAPGPVADRLLAAFADEESDGFAALAQDLLAAGRHDVLDLALRKLEARDGEDAADELFGALLAEAEGGALGPSGWAELVALPVALPPGAIPDAAVLAEGLLASGAIPDTSELRFLPGWRSPEALAGLAPGAMRRVLLDLLAGTEPRDLPPGDTDELAARGFGVMLGLQIDWSIQAWDAIATLGGLPAEPEGDDEETPEEARLGALLDRWRSAAFEAHGGCVPLALVAPSEVGAEIDAFLEEAGDAEGGLEEIVQAIAVVRQEAGEQEVVCRAEVIGKALELSFYTDGGRFLDSLTLGADRLPVPAAEMPRLLQGVVRLATDVPGR